MSGDAAAAPAAPAEGGAADAGGASEGGDAGAASEAAEVAAQLYKLKIAGEERELPIDEVLTLAQKGAGAELKFEEAAKLRKEAQGVLEALPKDVRGALEHLTGSKEAAQQALLEAALSDTSDEWLDALSERILKVHEYRSLPKEERAKRDEEAELRRKAKKAEEYEAAETQRAIDAEAQRQQGAWQTKLTGALEQHGLGSDPVALSRLATLVEGAIESGDRSLTLEGLAAKVAETHGTRRTSHLEELAGIEDDDAFLEALSPAVLKRAQTVLARKAKGRVASQTQRTKPSSGERREPASKRTTTEDFFKKLRGA